MTVKPLQKIQAHADRDIKKLLNAWVEAVHRYMQIANDHDNTWWYNERANISSLAGAAWTLEGWTAMEEYNTRKRIKPVADGVEDSKTDRTGRADLYIANKKTSFVIEAKHVWQRFGPKADTTRFLREGMLAAWNDINDAIPGHATRKLAATFVIPSIAQSDIQNESEDGLDAKKLRALLNQWLETVGNFQRPGGNIPYFAYIFPGLGNESFNWGSRHYPGVVLTLEELVEDS